LKQSFGQLGLIISQFEKSQIIEEPRKLFLGSSVFVDANSRLELPFKKADEQVPVWKVLKSVIGQDLTTVSMPVFLNEPLTGLQRTAEIMILGIDLLERAAVCQDPNRRLALATVGIIQAYSSMKLRKRKPFNPMLGETYELVTENYRFLAEKVQHTPMQIVAFSLEGRGYKINGFNQPQPKFKFNGGRGQIDVGQLGTIDIYFKDFDEHISITKPTVQCRNVIWGGLYIDIEQEIKAYNLKTKENISV